MRVKTCPYEQASYALQNTADVVQQHYGRFLPQDKAALAAKILNEVWEAADLREEVLQDPPCPKPPPPRHLAQPKLQNNPPRRLRRHIERLRHHFCRHQWLRHHQVDELGQFRRSSASVQLSLEQCPGQRQPVMFFQSDLGGRDQPVGDGEQPSLPIAMPSAIDGNGLEAKVDAARWAPLVTPAWRRIEAANNRPSHGAC